MIINYLDTLIRHKIQQQGGFLALDEYLQLCLQHPEYGYYRRADPLGATGDFITAPEISQLFGEMIGLWCLQQWQRLQQPLQLIELGAGRGTLMADVVRTLKTQPAALDKTTIHIIESSIPLTYQQQQTLHACPLPLHWHTSLENIPDNSPCLILANEFFDALPIQQYCYQQQQWWQRGIGLSADQRTLHFQIASQPTNLSTIPISLPDAAPAEGNILEHHPEGTCLFSACLERLQRQNGALLLIDYGSDRHTYGDTLQAVRQHQPTSPLTNCGTSDITAHVPFALWHRYAISHGFNAHLSSQRHFLLTMGIQLRLQQLLYRATSAQATRLHSGYERLTAADAMGNLFKVLQVHTISP